MKNILVFPKVKFSELSFIPNSISIRIIDPEQSGHTLNHPSAFEIKLEFWDLDSDLGRLKMLSNLQALDIVSFLIEHKELDTFIFHCEYGISRSYTCAVFFATQILKNNELADKIKTHEDQEINYGMWAKLNEAYFEYFLLKDGL